MNIGFIGLGLMGAPMANRLLGSGHTLFVYNRTKTKADAFLAHGAKWCETPAEAARNANIIFSMLSAPPVLEEIALGPDGVLNGMKPNSIHVDCSTVSPVLTSRLESEYRERRSFFLHAPVLGSVPNAADGSLLLFVGGEERAYQRVEPLLKMIGSRIWRFERSEEATHVKLLCNFFIGAMITTLAQALVYSERNHINPKLFLEILSHSSLNSPMYQTKGASIIDDNFTPRFFLENMFKDVSLILESANASGSPLPVAELARRLFAKAMEAGLAKEDYSAVVKVLRTMRDA